MRSLRSGRFNRMFRRLSEETQEKAVRSFKLWMNDTTHPGLHFEKVDDEANIWSARVDLNYRALCVKDDVDRETVYTWFWIGPHDEYERMI